MHRANTEVSVNMSNEHTAPGAPEAPAAATTAAEQLPADTMESLQARLLAADQKTQELNDAWLRAKAETENVRRRAEDEAAKVAKFAIEDFAKANSEEQRLAIAALARRHDQVRRRAQCAKRRRAKETEGRGPRGEPGDSLSYRLRRCGGSRPRFRRPG